MPTVERSISINVPAQEVYAAYVNLDRWLEWNPHMREVKPLAEGPLAVGSRVRITLRTGLSSTWEVTELNPGRSFAWASTVAPGVRAVFDHIAAPAEGATRATLRIDTSGPLGVVAFPVLQFLYSRNLDRSLAALKRLLEEEKGQGAAKV